MGIPENLGCGRISESRQIPPVKERLRPTIGIADLVAVVLLKANLGNRVVISREAGRRKTSTDEANAANLPSTQ